MFWRARYRILPSYENRHWKKREIMVKIHFRHWEKWAIWFYIIFCLCKTFILKRLGKQLQHIRHRTPLISAPLLSVTLMAFWTDRTTQIPVIARLESAILFDKKCVVSIETSDHNAGLILTKICSRLSYESLDCLCFLR